MDISSDGVDAATDEIVDKCWLRTIPRVGTSWSTAVAVRGGDAE
jgi:hypothetical protein